MAGVARGLLDWLAAHVEPYLSFRFLLALLLGGLVLQSVIVTFLVLRDAVQQDPGATERERQIARITRLFAGCLLLRLFSRESLRRHGWVVAQIVLLATAAIALHSWVFTGRLFAGS